MNIKTIGLLESIKLKREYFYLDFHRALIAQIENYFASLWCIRDNLQYIANGVTVDRRLVAAETIIQFLRTHCGRYQSIG